MNEKIIGIWLIDNVTYTLIHTTKGLTIEKQYQNTIQHDYTNAIQCLYMAHKLDILEGFKI